MIMEEQRAGFTQSPGEPRTFSTVTTCRVCSAKFEAQGMIAPMFRNPIVPTICPLCDEEIERKRQAKERAEQEERRITHRKKRADEWNELCPREYRLTSEGEGETDLDRLKLECRQLDRILAWTYQRRGLVIRSKASGMSKTRAAWRLLKKMWDEKRTIAYYTAGAFQRRAQDAAGNYTITAWFEKLIVTDVVFLDDLGKGYWTENTEALWFDLVEQRTANHKPVIVTTNYTGDELIKGSRSEATTYTIRRLRDYCEAIALD
jgi:DNA replication protein DnaC